jgi:hypothetical protein
MFVGKNTNIGEKQTVNKLGGTVGFGPGAGVGASFDYSYTWSKEILNSKDIFENPQDLLKNYKFMAALDRYGIIPSILSISSLANCYSNIGIIKSISLS